MSTHPEILWAQRSSSTTPEKNVVYLTVNLRDIVPSTLEYVLTASTLSFKARTSGTEQTEYAFGLEFFAEVDPENSTKRLTPRSLSTVLRKKELNSEFWSRLTKDKIKTPFLKIDFDKWVDEDEQDGNPPIDDDFGAGGFPGMDPGFDFSKMGDFGASASRAEAENDPSDEDSNDEGPPPLEDPESTK